MNYFEKFLEEYRREALTDTDKALWNLLKAHQADVEPLFNQRDPSWLHASFRKFDVIHHGRGRVDMAIWHLMHKAPDFWQCLEHFWERMERKEAKVRTGEVGAWVNGCDRTAPAALRHLANHDRPLGGKSNFNGEHLEQIASELEATHEKLAVHAERLEAELARCQRERGEALAVMLRDVASQIDDKAHDKSEWGQGYASAMGSVKDKLLKLAEQQEVANG